MGNGGLKRMFVEKYGPRLIKELMRSISFWTIARLRKSTAGNMSVSLAKTPLVRRPTKLRRLSMSEDMKFRVHFDWNGKSYFNDFDSGEAVREFVQKTHFRCFRIDLIEPYFFVLMEGTEVQDMKWRLSA